MKRNRMFFVTLAAAVIVVGVFILGMTSWEKKQTDDQQGATASLSLDTVTAQMKLAEQPVKGDRKAPIQIVEFGDYKCPSCKVWTDTIYPLLERDYVKTGKAAFYYMNDPFLAPDSTLAALAGEYLHKQDEGLFWRYHELMNEKQGVKKEAWANETFLFQLIQEHFPEVNAADFQSKLQAREFESVVNADIEVARKFEVGGTPTIFINGKMAPDGDYESLKAMIEAELQATTGEATN
ncbi:DsbA family protein [Paenibacillus taiwanensis]|uniref:DsbA family protein n=1 Tax=Paenibacillus taiwanensis TaxID=401638 RepID=UPI0004029AAA|nr:DsbA family protein [Paenibacillus taiwanensis]